MTQEQFDINMRHIWDVVNHRPNFLRKGQALYTECYHRFEHYDPPTLSNKDIDCFYNDVNINAFINSLKTDLVE